MTKAKLQLMVRVFRNKIAEGASFDEVAADYPKLTQEELEEIRAAL